MNKLLELKSYESDLLAFQIELFELMHKYNISISHQDSGGAFEFGRYNVNDSEWMYDSLNLELDSIETLIKDLEENSYE